MPVPTTAYPTRGQEAPAYWDDQLKAYIDEHDAYGLEQAEGYADSKAALAQSAAQAYTDTKVLDYVKITDLDGDAAALINDTGSDTRSALDALYVAIGSAVSDSFIHPSAYGAVGDGTADDSSALAAAYAAAAAIGYGTVIIDKVFGWKGTLSIPDNIGTYALSSASLKALDSTSRLQVGSFSGSHTHPGPIVGLTVNGNSTGDTTGLVWIESVRNSYRDVTITNAAGRGAVVHGAQNNHFDGFDVLLSGDDSLTLDYGAGGNLFSRCELHGTANRALVMTESGPGVYPFAPTHNSFKHCIAETAVNGVSMVDIEAASLVVFNDCAFSVNVNTVSMSSGYMFRILNNPAYGSILNNVELNSVFFYGGGTAMVKAIYVQDYQHLRLTGHSFAQNHSDWITYDGQATITQTGTIEYSTVTNKFTASGGSANVTFFGTVNELPTQFKLPSVIDAAIKTGRDTDSFASRFWLNRDGGMAWGTGSVYAPALAGFGWDATNTNLALTGGLMKLGRRGDVAQSHNISSNGQTTTCDTRAYSVHTFSLFANAGAVTLTNPLTDAEVTIVVAQDATGGRTFTWPTASYAGGAAPTDTSANSINAVCLRYFGTGWVEMWRRQGSGSGVYEPAISAGTTSQYWRGDKSWQTLDKTAVGLSNVDNTSDATKFTSPALTGTPTAPTPSTADNSTKIATTAYVQAQGYLTGASAASTYAPLASPTFTGDPKAPTPTAGDNDTSIATTAFVTTAISGKADLASPTFTGDPKAPTPAAGDNDTSIATTAFVNTAITNKANLYSGTSATAVGTAAKAVTISGWTPATGDILGLVLTNGNSATNPTLAVNGGTAYSIYIGGALAVFESCAAAANGMWFLQFGGSRWNMIAPTTDVIAATTAQMQAGTSTTNAWMTPALVKAAVANHVQNVQTASYTLALADAGNQIEMNVASANTVTVPPNSSVAFAIGTWIDIEQYGAGATTISPGAGVTLRGSVLTTSAQYGMLRLYKRGTDEWVVTAWAASAGQSKIVSGSCSTSSGTAAKTVTISGYTLTAGDILAITFTNGSNAGSPTLAVNGGSAIPILVGGSVSSAFFNPTTNGVTFLYYDGTNFDALGSYWNQGTASQSEAEAGTSTSLRGWTPQRVKQSVANVQLNTQTANYTLALTDAGSRVEMNVASANTVTVPPNSSVTFSVGAWIQVVQYGAGQITITPGSGVTLRYASSLTSRAQYSVIYLHKRATDEWVVSGDCT